jgi:hypothetical protein
MDVGMMLQGLPPRVQDGGDAELGAEAPWIGGDGDERLGGRAHQNGIDPSLVLESDLGRRRRQGEDDVPPPRSRATTQICDCCASQASAVAGSRSGRRAIVARRSRSQTSVP